MILAIVQARCGSTRLPEKVLAPVLGRPMLALQLERLQRAESVDAVLVATSVDPADEAVAILCAELEVDCFRGSHADVLDRYQRAAFARGATHVVRLPGDCPLCDPEVVDRVVDLHLDGEFDYTTNVPPAGRTFPDGLDVEVVRAPVLAAAWREALTPFEREHVTPFVRNRPERFHIGYVRDEVDLSQHRWTVDELADLALVRGVYEGLYPENPAFTTREVLAFLEAHPDVARQNAHLASRGCTS